MELDEIEQRLLDIGAGRAQASGEVSVKARPFLDGVRGRESGFP